VSNRLERPVQSDSPGGDTEHKKASECKKDKYSARCLKPVHLFVGLLGHLTVCFCSIAKQAKAGHDQDADYRKLLRQGTVV